MNRTAKRLFFSSLVTFLKNTVSAQLSWFNGHRFRVWFTPLAASDSCTDNDPKTSRITRVFRRPGTLCHWCKPKEIFESLDKNLTWLAIHGTRACATCTELQQQPSGMGPRPKQGPPGFQWGIHCSILLLFPNIWTNGICAWRRIQNSFKHKENSGR